MSESANKTGNLVTGLVLLASGFALGQLLCSFWKTDREEKLRLEIKDLQDQVQKQTELRAVERSGRIALQRQEREHVLKEQQKDGYSYLPIGHVETPFPDRRGTPRQPILVPAAAGRIRFNKQLIQFEHYEELKLFSHIWIVFVFHNNTNTEKLSKVSKIKPPRLHGAKVGCLSTRSPHRPNNIGLSVCEIVNVTKDFIDISGVDLVDGTPILDVKPYIPYDMVPSDYVLPMATSADGTPLQSRKLSVPDWVVDSDIVMQHVRISEEARRSLEQAVIEGVCKHYRDVDSLIEFITQVLRQDIRGVHQGRGNLLSVEEGEQTEQLSRDSKGPRKKGNNTGSGGDSVYNCRLDNISLDFITTSLGIEVTRVTF